MEGNRDEAEKCINIALKCLEAGDKEKAVKFLNKAEKLYPTEKAKGKELQHPVSKLAEVCSITRLMERNEKGCVLNHHRCIR